MSEHLGFPAIEKAGWGKGYVDGMLPTRPEAYRFGTDRVATDPTSAEQDRSQPKSGKLGGPGFR